MFIFSKGNGEIKVRINGPFKDACYKENCANSQADTKIGFSEDEAQISYLPYS